MADDDSDVTVEDEDAVTEMKADAAAAADPDATQNFADDGSSQHSEELDIKDMRLVCFFLEAGDMRVP